MHDIRRVRADPHALDVALARRGHAPVAETMLALDLERRTAEAELQAERARRKAASKEIGDAFRRGDVEGAEALKRALASDPDGSAALEARVEAATIALRTCMEIVPNAPHPDVPDGTDERGNVEIRRWGAIVEPDFEVRMHDELDSRIGIDAASATAISGARFTCLRGPAARLARALGQFMLDRLVDGAGYEEIAPPLLVGADALRGTGQLPKFADDLFRTTDDRWLIPTGEVPLTNLVRDRILAEDVLPLRFAALTPCFRQEAGAAGRDTRGLIRQHQFEKVEMVSVVAPHAAGEELERMVRCAEGVLEALEIPYRRMALCAGDMGFSARRTFDLEAWLPGQKAWREISSCSDCGDFQSIRMDARIRTADGMVRPSILNGSGLAVGRTLVAVLENHQTPDGDVVVPSVLRPYMGGRISLLG